MVDKKNKKTSKSKKRRSGYDSGLRNLLSMGIEEETDLENDNEDITDTLDDDTKTQETSETIPVQDQDVFVHEISLEDLIPAPRDWNFYRPLSEDKMRELIDSIEDHGLLHPIVVWEQENGKYMILSGHNRVAACRILYELHEDEKYLKILASIKGKDEITEDDAKQIIVDSNWVQRNLTHIEKAKSILTKYVYVQKNRDKYKGKGKTRDIVAKEYQLTGRRISEYIKLNNLIEPFLNMLNNNELTLKSAIKLASFDQEIQNYIFEKYSSKLNNKTINTLKNDMSKEEIDDVFTDDASYKIVEIQVPENYVEEFKEKAQLLLEEILNENKLIDLNSDEETEELNKEKNELDKKAENKDIDKVV